jgi:hypothetical protein
VTVKELMAILKAIDGDVEVLIQHHNSPDKFPLRMITTTRSVYTELIGGSETPFTNTQIEVVIK